MQDELKSVNKLILLGLQAREGAEHRAQQRQHDSRADAAQEQELSPRGPADITSASAAAAAAPSPDAPLSPEAYGGGGGDGGGGGGGGHDDSFSDLQEQQEQAAELRGAIGAAEAALAEAEARTAAEIHATVRDSPDIHSFMYCHVSRPQHAPTDTCRLLLVASTHRCATAASTRSPRASTASWAAAACASQLIISC